ncbi:hypothetical protein LY78DRAFT_682306 [Colletotrichum sublineola]|nr:hypothetical protein LY78DRAFT_682306 [Colletotrichum sublineola]
MHFTTSSVLAATLLAASASAAGFCQEYSFTDGAPCTKGADGNFQCLDEASNSTVGVSMDGSVQITSNNENQAGVKITCGAGNSTYFVAAKTVRPFTQASCNGTAPSSVIAVKSAKQLTLPAGGQDVTFTDGTPCTAQGTNGRFLCGDSQGATISEANRNVTMTAGAVDAAVKVSCSAGSSVYFCSAGGSTNFTEPTCGGGFDSVISVKAEAPILQPFGLA